MPAAFQAAMVPISRRKKVAGVVGAIAFGYALSWITTPGPGTGPVDKFSPTFGQSVAPVIVSPNTSGARSGHGEIPAESAPKALQKRSTEPI